MPQLFALPRQVPLSSSGALMAGAKLYFYQTGSSTPQNTYSDINLTTPNANPVVADANGVFSKIYLDASLPSYRVTLKTSADVTVYTEDDVPSNQNTSQVFRLKATAPELIYEETDVGANLKKWSIRADAQVLTFDVLNDAENSRTNVASITRAGVFQVSGKSAATTVKSSFGATLTGFGSATNGIVVYEVLGQHVDLYVAAGAAISGTSNATSFTITGLPAAVVPGTAVLAPCVLTNNGTQVMGSAAIASGGTVITFSMGSPFSSTGFTASGTKGLPDGWVLSFNRNTLA